LNGVGKVTRRSIGMIDQARTDVQPQLG
jgi:hypothetical protein